MAPLEDDKTSPEMANLIEQEVKRFTKVLLLVLLYNNDAYNIISVLNRVFY